MSDKHIPEPQFVARLEAHVRLEARRLREARHWAAWPFGSRLRLGLAAAALAVVSMGVGAAGVAAAYQAKTNEQRELLMASYQRRLDLAREQLKLAADQLGLAQRRVDVGLASRDEVADGQAKVGEAQAVVATLASQLQEVQATGRDPLDDLSAPLVSGHDFVSERLSLAVTAQRSALDAQQGRLREAERRLAAGVADSLDVDVARARIVEAQSAVALIQRKLELRRTFLAGGLDVAQTDLRALEAEAEQRRTMLAPQVQLALQRLARIQSMMQKGLAQEAELADARLKLLQAQADLAKADLDLALVRRQLAKGKTGGS